MGLSKIPGPSEAGMTPTVTVTAPVSISTGPATLTGTPSVASSTPAPQTQTSDMGLLVTTSAGPHSKETVLPSSSTNAYTSHAGGVDQSPN